MAGLRGPRLGTRIALARGVRTLSATTALAVLTLATLARAEEALTLDRALSDLDRQNLSLVEARARADEASAIARQAEAALLPTLSASGSYVRNSDAAEIDLSRLPLPPSLGLPSSIVMQPLESWTAGAALRVPLVVPSAWFDYRAAREGEHALAASAQSVRAAVRTGFAQSAYAAAALAEVVTASERAVELAAEQLKSAERRVQAGTASPLDALRAKTELVRRKSDLVRARSDRARAELAMGVLLGRREPVRVEVPPPPETTPAGGVDEALSARPELPAAQAQIDAANAQITSAWARLLPQLYANGSLFASDVPYPTGKKDGWRVSLDLTWTLYDGGLRYGKWRQGEALLRSAEAGKRAQRLTIVEDVENGRRELNVARERMDLATQQQTLASDAAASAKRSFDAGVASTLDVLDANDRLYQADVGVADARARLAQSLLGLERALGRGR
jgi:outer membrane protein TolC